MESERDLGSLALKLEGEVQLFVVILQSEEA